MCFLETDGEDTTIFLLYQEISMLLLDLHLQNMPKYVDGWEKLLKKFVNTNMIRQIKSKENMDD